VQLDSINYQIFTRIRSDEGLTLKTSAFNLFTMANIPLLSTQLINPTLYITRKVTTKPNVIHLSRASLSVNFLTLFLAFIIRACKGDVDLNSERKMPPDDDMKINKNDTYIFIGCKFCEEDKNSLLVV